ncbi:MAG TPA: D-2-hydroxyacid dehydrogenase [Kiloniellales bacterium]
MAKVKVHIKNNHASPDTFPPTPEGEAVFTITRERYEAAAARHPDVAGRIEAVIDWDLDNFARSMASAEALVTWDLPTANLREVAPKLKWIHIIGAGVEHLCPLDWLPDGVTLVNNKGAHAAKAGEFGLMAVLMLHTRMPAVMTNQQSAHWESLYATPVAGRTLLIVGVGSIGGAVARHAKALGLRVLGVSRHGRAHPDVERMVTPDGLDALLPEADFVFVSTPATPETRKLIDRRRLALMKPGAGLVNVGRAAVVDYEALSERLEAGQLSGAILDVFDPEPLPPDSPLWRTRNLLVMPHISADDGCSYVALTLDLFFANMRRYLAGEPLHNVVRPDLGY